MSYSKRGIKLTNEEFDGKIKDSNFIRLTEYINTNTSLEFKCKRCGKIFKKKPKYFNTLICKCDIRSENYMKSIKDKHITLIEPYTNMKDKLLHRCDKCSHEFRTPPRTVQSSVNGCPVCSGRKFNSKRYRELLPSNIELVGKYIDTATKTEHRCLECEYEWSTKPNYILHMNTGCPQCNSSKGEKMISSILDELNIDYITEYMVNIDNQNLRYDFYIESLRLFIEYDGIQHYEPVELFGGKEEFERIRDRDRLKDMWSIDNDMKLLRIPYTVDNMESIKEIIVTNI